MAVNQLKLGRGRGHTRQCEGGMRVVEVKGRGREGGGKGRQWGGFRLVVVGR